MEVNSGMYRPGDRTRASLGHGERWPTQLQERLRNHLTEEREVAVRFGVWPFDDDLGRDELARRQIEGVRERNDAGISKKDRPMGGLDLFGQALEGDQEGDRARLLVDNRRRSGHLLCERKN